MERARDHLGLSALPFMQSVLPQSPNARWLRMQSVNNYRSSGASDPRVLVSVQIVPQEEADDAPVGSGRAKPNRSPYLPKPVGRISLSFAHPFGSCYQLLGRKLMTRLLCAIVLAAVLTIGYYVCDTLCSAPFAAPPARRASIHLRCAHLTPRSKLPHTSLLHCLIRLHQIFLETKSRIKLQTK